MDRDAVQKLNGKLLLCKTHEGILRGTVMDIRSLSSSLSSDLLKITPSSDFATRFQRGANLAARSLTTLVARMRTMTGVTVLTAEGDKVTLSTDTAVRVNGATYDARGLTEGQTFRLVSHAGETKFARRQFVTVEGDLNEQELHAIQQVVKRVNTVSRHIASGNLSAALAAGAEIEATGTLAAVDVRIQHVQAVAVQHLGHFVGRERQGSQIAEPTGGSSQFATPTVKDAVDSTREDAGNMGTELDQLTRRLVKEAEHLLELLEQFESKLDQKRDHSIKSPRAEEPKRPPERDDHDQGGPGKSLESHGETFERIVEQFVSKLRDSLAKVDKGLNRAGAE